MQQMLVTLPEAFQLAMMMFGWIRGDDERVRYWSQEAALRKDVVGRSSMQRLCCVLGTWLGGRADVGATRCRYVARLSNRGKAGQGGADQGTGYMGKQQVGRLKVSGRHDF
jgi:hypothetical protein